jgi:hypothetical protein
MSVLLYMEVWRPSDVDSGILCGVRLDKVPLPLVIGYNIALAPYGAVMPSSVSGTHKQYSLLL